MSLPRTVFRADTIPKAFRHAVRENKVLRKYMVQKREDYYEYNKICGLVTKMVAERRLRRMRRLSLRGDDPRDEP